MFLTWKPLLLWLDEQMDSTIFHMHYYAEQMHYCALSIANFSFDQCTHKQHYYNQLFDAFALLYKDKHTDHEANL